MLEFHLRNGIGDKLLDIFNIIVYCSLKPDDYLIVLNNNKQNEGRPDSESIYPIELFSFQNINIIDSNKSIENHNDLLGNTAITLSPRNLQKHFKVQNIRPYYTELSNQIQCSELISKHLPNGIENAVGIHLRKSDKIANRNGKIISTKNNKDELDYIKKCIHKDILCLIDQKIPVFICSEDESWKNKFEKFVLTNGGTLIQSAIKDSKTPGFDAVLDLFCLSRCKCIIQGTKYSSFSITAALIGKKPLVNYLLKDHNIVTHIWKDCINLYIDYQTPFDTKDVNIDAILDKWESISDSSVCLNSNYLK